MRVSCLIAVLVLGLFAVGGCAENEEYKGPTKTFPNADKARPASKKEGAAAGLVAEP